MGIMLNILVQEKVDMLTEKVESTGIGNVDTCEKQGELGGSDGTIGSTKTAVSKKTCKLTLMSDICYDRRIKSYLSTNLL